MRPPVKFTLDAFRERNKRPGRRRKKRIQSGGEFPGGGGTRVRQPRSEQAATRRSGAFDKEALGDLGDY